MALITTSNHPHDLWPGVAAWFGTNLKQHNPEYTDLFDRYTSNKAYEEYVQSTGMGYAPVKAQGAALQYDAGQEGYLSRLTNVTYALGYAITMEELQDNLYAEVSRRRAGDLAISMMQTKEVVAATVYDRAFNSSYPIGDGEPLISASHPTVGGSVQSNLITVASDLSELALENLLIQIMQTQDDRNFQIANMARCLVVHPSEYFNACRILDSVLQNDTANNATNAIRAKGLIPDGVKVNHYLTDPNAWFLRTDCPGPTMIYQERMKLKFDKDNDFNTKNALASSVERYTFGVGEWRGIFASPGAS